MNLLRTLLLLGLSTLITQFSGCGGEDLGDYRVLDGSARPEPSAQDNAATPEPTRSVRSETAVVSNGSGSGAAINSPPRPVADSPIERDAPPIAPQSTSPAQPDAQPESESAQAVVQTSVETPMPPAQGAVPGPLPPGRATLPRLKREIKLLVPEKVFVPEGKEQALRVSFDDIDLLKVLNMDPVPPNVMSYLPDWLKGLDGKRVRLRGWMYPPSSETGITRFMFVRDNGICCFGRLPMVYDKVAVTLKDGESTGYIQGRAFDVVGTFVVDADVEDGDVMWLYALDDAIVIDE